MDRVKDNLKKYYESKSLPEEKIELLTGSDKDQMSPMNEYGLIWKSAVAVIVIIGFIFAYQQFTLMNLEGRVFKEIAMNHKKELNIEFPTDSLTELKANLDKLDFDLLKAQEFLSGSYELIGGRYCSIQGNLAAQLSIKNKENNNIETLYVTGATGELQNLKATKFNYQGTHITVWNEDGNLYGLASNN